MQNITVLAEHSTNQAELNSYLLKFTQMKILTKISLLCLLIIVSSCGQEVENQPSNETNQVIETIMARRSIRAYKPDLEMAAAGTCSSIVRC